MNKILNDYINTVLKIKNEKPVIHNITNSVTIQDCANIIAAMGASPVMAHYSGEVANITSISKSLVINTGTPTPERFDAAICSGKYANKNNIPIIFDPVGVGASLYRIKNVNKFLEQVKPDIIKGNASEIKVLAGITPSKNKGVDSVEDTDKTLEKEAFKLAKAWKCIIAATGKTDIITNGKEICKIKRGSTMLANISGTGCMLSSIAGCFCAVEKDFFKSCIYAVLTMDIIGEVAESYLIDSDGIGMFKVRLFDAVSNIHKINIDLEKDIQFY